jgi:translation initiation factor 2 subunit 1
MTDNTDEIMRMYENEYPDDGDVVMVKANSQTEYGVYVSLLEYKNIEGLIPTNELANKQRTLTKVKPGTVLPVVVIRVDKVKGTIDLSKRKVSLEEVADLEKKWNKTKTVDRIIKMVAKQLNVTQVDLMTSIVWPMYKTHEHPYDVFRRCAHGGLESFSSYPKLHSMSQDYKDSFVDSIQKIIKISQVKIRAQIELTCFTSDGVLTIRKTLKETLNSFPDISLHVVAPPLYAINLMTFDSEKGLEDMANILNYVKISIESSGGNMSIKNEAAVVSLKDELEEDSDHEEDEE